MGKIELATDEQKMDDILDKLDTPAESTTPAPAPQVDTAKATPEPDKKPAETPAQTPEVAIPATDSQEPVKETPPVADKATEPKLYAGKYNNVFDLTHAVQEAGKVLGKENKESIALFEEAQKSGDWTKVESKYKELQSELTKKNQAEKDAVKDGKSPTETSKESVSTEVIPQEWQTHINTETMNRFKGTELAARMESLGIAIPTNQEEVNRLYSDNWALGDKFEGTVKELYNAVVEDAQHIIHAKKEAPVHNKQQIDTAKQQINELMTKWNADLPKEDIDKSIDSILKDQTIYEGKYSEMYIKKNEILRRFIADNAERLHSLALEKAKAETANNASVKTVQALDDVKKKNPPSIGSTSVAPRSTKVTTIDLTDRKQVGQLSNDEQEQALIDVLSSL